MNDFSIEEILAKTSLYSTINQTLSILAVQKVPKYKELMVQITNIDSKSETITLSDSFNTFIFCISTDNFNKFKKTIRILRTMDAVVLQCLLEHLWENGNVLALSRGEKIESIE